MLLSKVLLWVLPLVTVAATLFAIFWFLRFANDTYETRRQRPKRRRSRWRRR